MASCKLHTAQHGLTKGDIALMVKQLAIEAAGLGWHEGLRELIVTYQELLLLLPDDEREALPIMPARKVRAARNRAERIAKRYMRKAVAA